MNMGYEEEELIPFKEPILDISDQKRIDILVGMGYNRSEVEESLRTHKFDDPYASYFASRDKLFHNRCVCGRNLSIAIAGF